MAACGRNDVPDDPDDEDRRLRGGEYEKRSEHGRSGRVATVSLRAVAPGADGGNHLPPGVDQGVDCGPSLYRAGVVPFRYLNLRS